MEENKRSAGSQAARILTLAANLRRLSEKRITLKAFANVSPGLRFGNPVKASRFLRSNSEVASA